MWNIFRSLKCSSMNVRFPLDFVLCHNQEMAKGIRGKLSAFKVQVYELLLLISVQIDKLEDVLHEALNEKNAEAMEAEISAYIDRLKGATESLREFLTDNTEPISREDFLKDRVDDLDFKDIDAWKNTLSDELIAKEISRHDVALDEMSKIKDIVTGLVERIKLFGGKVNYDMFLMYPGDDEYFGSRDHEMVD
ncbi:uncharacterized protein LOC132622682 [Lycium barbarum]|uniref:uncharacterized protein LOC132622682 n=1 Tax=Lycium barbarum TaxID=112863 RepID=UPI00293F6D55|nr:uncharacterized protein LOC132622682 [Lycium barbarum]XP_060193319.1 uncharacterized protein LOC132622682 [Lycium barbarum]